jgi:hypothetical protein
LPGIGGRQQLFSKPTCSSTRHSDFRGFSLLTIHLHGQFFCVNWLCLNRARPHRGYRPAWLDLGERWPSRMVATAAEDRLSFRHRVAAKLSPIASYERLAPRWRQRMPGPDKQRPKSRSAKLDTRLRPWLCCGLSRMHVGQPEPASFGLFIGDLQPLASPDRRGSRFEADVASKAACLAGEVTAAIVGQPLDGDRQGSVELASQGRLTA